MGFQINTNLGALKAYNALAELNSKSEKAQLRLATQKRINSVADDTAGFNTGKALEQKLQLMQAAKGNVGSAKDMLATTESQLISIKDLLIQIKTKQAEASNPAANKASISKEIKSIALEIANAFASTKFNDTNLLMTGAGDTATSFTYQTGADKNDTIAVDYRSGLAGATSVVDGGTDTGAVLKADIALDLNNIIAVGDTTDLIRALSFSNLEDAVDDALGKIGNTVQRLDAKDDFLTSAIANSQASVSRIFDADMALEQLNATKATIGGQAATAMLGQLNMSPQQVLQLLNS